MNKNQVRVVFDTNIIYAGLYSSMGASFKLLEAIEKGKIKIVLSSTLLFEYEDIIKRNQANLGLTDIEVEEILDYLCLKSDHQKIYFLWRPFLQDPKDDHILELAVASRVQHIVTFNVKDFREVYKFGVSVLTPKEFMEKYYECFKS